MTAHAEVVSECGVGDAATVFYRAVMHTLQESNIPFLIGGAFALARYTGIERNTKDLDLFLKPADYPRAVRALEARGHRCELTYPHWLGKVHDCDTFIDLIFNSGNGLTPVDDAWFEHAAPAEVLGVPVRVMPPEETIWSKAFIMERERFDGADVAHLLRDCARTLDWQRLVARFGDNWRVLLSHLVNFGFIYPGHRDTVPGWVMDSLTDRLRREPPAAASEARLCRGTLISRQQYLHDVEHEGYVDARMTPASTMTPADVERWTAAIDR